jgi:purine-binding chemotaxis protein CheW
MVKLWQTLILSVMFDRPGNYWKQDTMQANLEQDHEKAAAGASREMLTFSVDGEEYGIEIHKVQEIRGYESVITHAPEFLKGEINMRGNIVPIVDMRVKFKLGRVSYNETAVVIIFNIANSLVGIVVDGVSEVMKLKPEQIKFAREFNTNLARAWVQSANACSSR